MPSPSMSAGTCMAAKSARTPAITADSPTISVSSTIAVTAVVAITAAVAITPSSAITVSVAAPTPVAVRIAPVTIRVAPSPTPIAAPIWIPAISIWVISAIRTAVGIAGVWIRIAVRIWIGRNRRSNSHGEPELSCSCLRRCREQKCRQREYGRPKPLQHDLHPPVVINRALPLVCACFCIPAVE
jgi:beta-lactamase regulating signal transducer with metallopeptidase domain